MVLTRSRGALAFASALAAAVAAGSSAGCGESLFDAHGARDGGMDGGDGDGSIDVPDTCQSPCVADAGRDFGNGTWRYLEDQRNRMWAEMTPSGNVVSGTLDAANQIRKCGSGATSDACKALPGALLLSAAGQASVADPAIEFTATEAKELQLVVRAHADGAGQRIRLYRNAREDLLITTAAVPAGATVERKVVVDALPGDRFLVALAPSGGGGAAAVHFFVTDTRANGLTTCRLAVPFPGPVPAGSTSVDDLCGDVMEALDDNTPSMPFPRTDPFGGNTAGYFEPGMHYRATTALSRGATMTYQLWVQHDANVPAVPYTWLFTDADEDLGGGIGIRVRYMPTPRIEASVVATTAPLAYADQFAPFPALTDYHFVRVIHGGDKVTICIDGTKVVTDQPLTGPTSSAIPPRLGRNANDPSTYFFGGIDDVRVFAGALPCD
jgi:hypothetical protein